MKNRLPALFILTLSVLLIFSGVVYAQSGDACTVSPAYSDFLESRYQIAFDGEVSQAEFTDALVLLMGETETPAEIDLDGFSNLEAILASLYYVNFDELAFTYPQEKVDANLEGVTLDESLSLARLQELAAALDSGLVDADCFALDINAPTDAAFAEYLLGRVLALSGQYKNYVGYVRDDDIYSRLVYTWNSFDQVSAPELQAPAVELIREGVITGYNLKRTPLDANFDPNLTIVYGHANIEHARQLIALLRSEDLDAKVLLEPKTSAFLYLAEWGEPSTSPGFQVEALDDGNYIAYAKEFDLAFEFNSVEDRNRFDGIILTYAKRNSSEQTGLILGSWWQPLYSSRVEIADYIAVKNNVVFTEQYYLQTFSLVEDSERIRESFEELYADVSVEVWDLWVNVAFHNYLLGEPL